MAKVRKNCQNHPQNIELLPNDHQRIKRNAPRVAIVPLNLVTIRFPGEKFFKPGIESRCLLAEGIVGKIHHQSNAFLSRFRIGIRNDYGVNISQFFLKSSPLLKTYTLRMPKKKNKQCPKQRSQRQKLSIRGIQADIVLAVNI